VIITFRPAKVLLFFELAKFLFIIKAFLARF